MANAEKTLTILTEKIGCPFLMGQPIRTFNLDPLTQFKNANELCLLLENTIKLPLNVEYPLPIRYQINFLNKVIKKLEEQKTKVPAAFLDAIKELETIQNEDDAGYRHYTIFGQSGKGGTVLSLRLDKHCTSGASPAALALAEFLMDKAQMFTGKNVMEIGAGNGLLGMLLYHSTKLNQICLTDPRISLMSENIRCNFPKDKMYMPNHFRNEDQSINCVQLEWADLVKVRYMTTMMAPDIFIASDIVHDEQELPDLVVALNHMFQARNNQVLMYMAVTLRFEENLEKFLKLLEENNYTIRDQEPLPERKGLLYWDRRNGVRIMLIFRNAKK